MKKFILIGFVFACLFLFLNGEARADRFYSFGFGFGYGHGSGQHYGRPYYGGHPYRYRGRNYYQPYGFGHMRFHGYPENYWGGHYNYNRNWAPGRWINIWNDHCRCWRQIWIPGW